jgi:D-amino peptidase
MKAVAKIRQLVHSALLGDVSRCRLAMPRHFRVEISYKEHAMALKASFYPGAGLITPHTVRFESGDYFEILRLFAFVL